MSVAQIRLICYFLQQQFICRYKAHAAQEPGPLFWCHAVLSLQFTHVHSFACKHRRSQGA